MMLEEAIKHCYEVLDIEDMCEECKQEHLQLAKWLEELKQRRSDISNDNKICKKFNVTATIDESNNK